MSISEWHALMALRESVATRTTPFASLRACHPVGQRKMEPMTEPTPAKVPASIRLRITNLQTRVEEPEANLPRLFAKRLGVRFEEVLSWRILRKSLDARKRDELRFVYSVLVEVPADLAKSSSLSDDKNVDSFTAEPFYDPPPGTSPMPDRPVVVGSGPAGLLAAYYLAKKGYRPIILERGQAVKERVPAIRAFDSGGPHDGENNYLFGEGGAGCFSDGKLTCRITGPDVDWVLERFVECGGRPSLVYEHRPHLGSNKLPMICRNFRRKIEALGGEYRFGCRLENLRITDGQITGIGTSSGEILTNHVILAIGHSARDTYEMLHQIGVPMFPKAFQLGLDRASPSRGQPAQIRQSRISGSVRGGGLFAGRAGPTGSVHVLHVRGRALSFPAFPSRTCSAPTA